MANLHDDVFDDPVPRLSSRFERRPQFAARVWRNTHGGPGQFGISFAEPAPFDFRQILTLRGHFPFHGEELVSLHPRQLLFRIASRSTAVPEGIEVLFAVPIMAFTFADGKTLPQVLTSRKQSIQMSQSFSRKRVWPPVTDNVDDASRRCSTTAWLYFPDLGTFPAEPPPSLRVRSAPLFQHPKSPYR